MKVLMAMIAMAGILALHAWGGAAMAAEKSPEVGTWEYVLALETGNLPADSGSSEWKHEARVIGVPDVYEDATWPFDAGMTATGTSPAEALSTVVIGGRAYRAGLDIGP